MESALVQTGAGPIPAYRTVTKEQAPGVAIHRHPEHKKADFFPAGWFDAWANAICATDPVGARANPPVLRAPNATAQDTTEYWSAGKLLRSGQDHRADAARSLA